MRIVNQRQAEEAYQVWRKDHPLQAVEADKEWEKMKQDPNLLITFLASKGFDFSMIDNDPEAIKVKLSLGQAIKVNERLRQKWWKSLPKVQRSTLTGVWTFFGVGVLSIILGLAFFINMFPLIRKIDYANPLMLKSTYDMAWLGGLFSAVSVFLWIGLVLWHKSLMHYTFYLEYRIKTLEIKLKDAEPNSDRK